MDEILKPQKPIGLVKGVEPSQGGAEFRQAPGEDRDRLAARIEELERALANLTRERDDAVAGQSQAEERMVRLRAKCVAAVSAEVGLKLQIAELTDQRAFLGREISRTYHRPWRPMKYAALSSVLMAMSRLATSFAPGLSQRMRQSALKRSPSRYDRFLEPIDRILAPLTFGGRKPLVPIDGVLLPEDARPLAASDVAGLSLPTSASPLVSVIIPSYGKAALTLQCLKSIAAHPPASPFEVLVVDDASGEPDIALLERVGGLRVETNPQNLGFLRSCNRAASLAKGDYLFFLNNDTILTDGWLEPLLEVFERFPDAGLVGSKLIYPDGSLQEAGGIVWRDGAAWNYGRGDHPDKPQFNYLREADYISGCAILAPRNLWDALGGFDERYAPAYCEDSDLAFRVREAGRKVYYCPFSVVVHLEGATMGTDVGAGLKAYQVANTETFRGRWRDTLASDHAAPGLDIMRARDRSRGGKTALIIDHYVPQPDQDAGSKTIMAMIEALMAAGYVVKFWPDNLIYDAEYTPALQRMGVEVAYGPISFEQWILENGEAIDLVLLSRPTVAPRYIEPLRAETGAKLVYYGHDLHFQRMRMEAELRGDKTLAADAVVTEGVERGIFRQVDVVLYPSPEEAAVASPDAKQAAAVQAYVYDDFGAGREPPAAHEITFVAGFAHGPNVDAALWLVRDIFPLIRARIPDATLALVGANPTEAVRALAGDRVKVTGRVSEEELRRVYATSRLAIIPLRFGAGVKSKVAEALREGLPLVTTTVGAQGLPGVRDVIDVEDDSQAIVDAAVRLLTENDRWLERSTRQVDYARRLFSRDAFHRTFLAAVEG